jgi:hypothetical protein
VIIRSLSCRVAAILATLLAANSVMADTSEVSWANDASLSSFNSSIVQAACEDGSCDPGCCDPGCGDACDCGSSVCDSNRLFGLFQHSDCCYDDFISPMTNPVFFEDPRTLTEARAIFLEHDIPGNIGGGDARLLALQLRGAITDRLSVIAVKDGYIMSTNALIDDGWADVAAGLKYNLYADPCKQQLLTAGLTYTLPVGSTRAFQGRGASIFPLDHDGEFHAFVTGGAQILEYGHWLSASGVRAPCDPHAASQMWYWSNHLDYEVADGWYLLSEINWFNWTDSGDNNTILPTIEGGDLFNFGSTNVTGNDIVTQAFGMKYKRNAHRELGLAFEFPLTDRKDVMDSRLTIDWIFRY